MEPRTVTSLEDEVRQLRQLVDQISQSRMERQKVWRKIHIASEWSAFSMSIAAIAFFAFDFYMNTAKTNPPLHLVWLVLMFFASSIGFTSMLMSRMLAVTLEKR